MDKESAFKKISELIHRFEEHKESYKKSDYNETQTRRDFIDPFFKALGWDIDNEQGLAEAYREVILEDKLKIDEMVYKLYGLSEEGIRIVKGAL